MNIKPSDACFSRLVKTSVKCIRVDLKTQTWTLAALNRPSHMTYQVRLTYHGDSGSVDAYAELMLDTDRTPVCSITLPWHTDTDSYDAGEVSQGLQMEGSASTHDQFLSALVEVMVNGVVDYDSQLQTALQNPDLIILGFQGKVCQRRLADIAPIHIPEHQRDMLYHFLSPISEGSGKMGAVAHMQWELGLSFTHAAKLAKEFINEYPSLFHQVRWGLRYELTAWGRATLEQLQRGLDSW